jgi:hypothetical protein
MNKLQDLMLEIKQLEDELMKEIQKKEEDFLYQIKGKKVVFEAETKKIHKTLATKLHSYILNASLLNVLTAPFIWYCLIPAVFLDVVVSLYQAVCFTAYGIPKVPRKDYIIIDRYSLSYLNSIEKLNCIFCGYFTGVIAYVQEIAARTEQYWCPVKHARKLAKTHAHYHKFIEYGDAESYKNKLAEIRRNFSDINK